MANFMICLSHFCELHGPCSIICTQVSNDSQDLLLKSSSKLQTCSSCKLTLPGNSWNLFTKSSNNKKPQKSANDNYFISTQYPSIQARYTSLTKLIMKSLSVETSSDITKPLYLGDNLNGYCLTKIFKIKDVSARGGERKYSLMIISDEEIQILKNWDIISNYLTKIISSIQQKVASQNNYLRSASNETSHLNNEHYLRRSLIKPKSLIELTGDDKIFVKLHLSSIELIKDIK